MGQLLVLAVAVAATVMTAGALAGASAQAMWGTGLSVLSGTATGMTTVEMVGASMAAGAVGSAASQVVGEAIGMQEGFSWRQVGLSALQAGMSSGAGSLVGESGGGVAGNAMAKAAAGNAMAQGISVVTGVQDRFNWTAVAASGIGAGVGTVVGQAAEYAGLGRIGTTFASSFAGGMAASALGGGQVSARQIVVNALGYSIVNGVAEPSQSENDLQRQEDMRDAAVFNALGGFTANNDWGGIQPEQALGQTFADDHAARMAANPLLNYQSIGEGSQSSSIAYDNSRSGGGIAAAVANGSDPRAALNAVEQQMNPTYYASRRGVSYTVQPNDTLSGILGGDITHVGLVAADNGLKGSTLQPGQTLFIADKDQYGEAALASFGRYGQAIYNQDNARLAELHRCAQLFVSDDGSGSDYGMLQRARESNLVSHSVGSTPPQLVERATFDALGNVTGREYVPIDNRPIMDSGEQIGKALTATGELLIGAAKGVANGVPELVATAAKGYAYLGAQLGEAAGALPEGATQRTVDALEPVEGRVFDYSNGLQVMGGVAGEMVSPGAYATGAELGMAGLRALGPTLDAGIYNYMQRTGGILSMALESSGTNSVDHNTLIDFNTIDNVAPGFYRANPVQLRFTQSDASPFFSKGGTIDSLVADIRAGKVFPEQVGEPLQIVMHEGKPFSIDNRRLVAFSQAGVSEVPIQVVSLKDIAIADRFFERFDPIGREGLKIVITPSSGRTAAQQLLQDYGLIRGVQLGR